MKSTTFSTPTIVVGNLNFGGTGKSPQIEYLIELLIQDYKVGVLSRGYKRKSKGFVLANSASTSMDLGDEPFQFYKKFPNCLVAVDANRINGIRQLQKLSSPPDIILLDDAFQHRKVKGGFNILLSSYGDLYLDDIVLPVGNLRESKKGAQRADLVVVTKCPEYLSENKKSAMEKELYLQNKQSLYFSAIQYNDSIISARNLIEIANLAEFQVLLVTGIANCDPLIEFLRKQNVSFEHLKYSDHYYYSEKDKKKIYAMFEAIKSNKKLILTTEKDYVRNFSEIDESIYYLPIKIKFLEKEEEFQKQIKNYVRSNTRNS